MQTDILAEGEWRWIKVYIYFYHKRQRSPKGQSKWTIQRNWQHRLHKTKQLKA